MTDFAFETAQAFWSYTRISLEEGQSSRTAELRIHYQAHEPHSICHAPKTKILDKTPANAVHRKLTCVRNRAN